MTERSRIYKGGVVHACMHRMGMRPDEDACSAVNDEPDIASHVVLVEQED